jgi:hypothetical protein
MFAGLTRLIQAYLKHPPFDGNIFIYHDHHHLNELGSIKYGDLLIGLLQPVFINNDTHARN